MNLPNNQQWNPNVMQPYIGKNTPDTQLNLHDLNNVVIEEYIDYPDEKSNKV